MDLLGKVSKPLLVFNVISASITYVWSFWWRVSLNWRVWWNFRVPRSCLWVCGSGLWNRWYRRGLHFSSRELWNRSSPIVATARTPCRCRGSEKFQMNTPFIFPNGCWKFDKFRILVWCIEWQWAILRHYQNNSPNVNKQTRLLTRSFKDRKDRGSLKFRWVMVFPPKWRLSWRTK